MHRLIWGFAGCKYHIVGNLMLRLKCVWAANLSSGDLLPPHFVYVSSWYSGKTVRMHKQNSTNTVILWVPTLEFYQKKKKNNKLTFNWSSTQDFGTYCIGVQQRLRQACSNEKSCQSLCSLHIQSMQVHNGLISLVPLDSCAYKVEVWILAQASSTIVIWQERILSPDWTNISLFISMSTWKLV